MLLPQPHRRTDTLVRVRRRHPHVRDHHVRQRALRRELRDGLDERLPVPDTRDDLVPQIGQKPGQALPQQHRILGDDHPHAPDPLIRTHAVQPP